MKKEFIQLAFVIGCCLLLTSCYTYTHTVGTGASTGVKVTEKNHYFIGGLAQGKQSNPREMAGSDNYEVTISHTFIDGLINALTFGIYTPTTTTVQK